MKQKKTLTSVKFPFGSSRAVIVLVTACEASLRAAVVLTFFSSKEKEEEKAF